MSGWTRFDPQELHLGNYFRLGLEWGLRTSQGQLGNYSKLNKNLSLIFYCLLYLSSLLIGFLELQSDIWTYNNVLFSNRIVKELLYFHEIVL